MHFSSGVIQNSLLPASGIVIIPSIMAMSIIMMDRRKHMTVDGARIR